jgi:plasmid stabilization system protein ParE
MPYSHRLHPLAHKDIVDAYEWYEIQQRGLGDKFAAAVEKKIKAIIDNPLANSRKTNIDFREALIKTFPFIIVYRVYELKREIFISSIHHASKHPKRKFRK